MYLIKRAAKKFLDRKAFSTDRKLLIIESDDWGSRRTDSKEVRDFLNKINPNISKDRFTQLDNTANEEDLCALYDVLNSVRDKNNNLK